MISWPQLPTVDLIKATQSTIRIKKLTQPWAVLIRTMISVVLCSGKISRRLWNHQPPTGQSAPWFSFHYHTKTITCVSVNKHLQDPEVIPQEELQEGLILSTALSVQPVNTSTPGMLNLVYMDFNRYAKKKPHSDPSSFHLRTTLDITTILAAHVWNVPHDIQNSADFASNIWQLKLASDETMLSCNDASLLTCIPTAEETTTTRVLARQQNYLHL